MKKLLFSAIVLVCMYSCKQPEPPSKQTKISPYLFGQNLWLTAGAEGRPGYIDELWPKVQESGVKIIRIGGNGYEHNLPGMDTLTKWVTSIKNIGAEPLFQVPKTATPAEAANLVNYFNKESGLTIKYWCIGNEPYLIKHNSIEYISKYIKELAPAMKAADPSIKIFVPDEATYVKELYEALLLNDKYSVAGRDQNGNWYIDGVTFHNYPNAKEYSRSDVVFFSVSKMRGMIVDMIDVMDQSNEKYQRSGEDELLWGVTEFNITYNNPDNLGADGIAVPSFINGQFWADVFAMTMEYEGFMATPWCIQESDRASTYFGYVGAPPDFTPHSTYYHTQMMSQNMSGNYIKMHSNDPWLKVFGSESEKNTVILMMNQDSTRTIEYDFTQINKQSHNSKLLITSESIIKADVKGEIEPSSTHLFVFDKSGKLDKHIHYSQEMAMKNMAPETINK